MPEKLGILIADDSPTLVAEMARILADLDDVAIVGTAPNGAAAVRLAGEARPDLVLLDIVMPGLDGLSALRTIRAKHPEIQVAMVSSLGDDPARAAEAYRLGAFEVLTKPLEPLAIEAMVEEARQRRPLREDGGSIGFGDSQPATASGEPAREV